MILPDCEEVTIVAALTVFPMTAREEANTAMCETSNPEMVSKSSCDRSNVCNISVCVLIGSAMLDCLLWMLPDRHEVESDFCDHVLLLLRC